MRGQAFIRTGEGNWYEGLDDERIFRRIGCRRCVDRIDSHGLATVFIPLGRNREQYGNERLNFVGFRSGGCGGSLPQWHGGYTGTYLYFLSLLIQ
jgi:hypothetical protein